MEIPRASSYRAGRRREPLLLAVAEQPALGDLAEQISTDLDEALDALAAIDGPLDQAIEDDYAQVEAFYEELRDVTSALKGDLATVLALKIPSEAAGDND